MQKDTRRLFHFSCYRGLFGRETMSFLDAFSSLPLLDYLDQQYQISIRKPFSGYTALVVQHLLGSTVPLLQAIESGGINKRDIYVVGKAYSSHHLVISHLGDLGYKVD